MFISASRVRGLAESAHESSVWRMPGQSFTDRQGQYLAFIDAYTRVHGRPPAETDMQRHFQLSPPSVHQMVLTLERLGHIGRQPGVARMSHAPPSFRGKRHKPRLWPSLQFPGLTGA